MNHLTRFSALFVLLIAILATSIYADAVPGSVNHLAPMMEDEAYGALLKHIFDGGDTDGAISLYEALETHMESADYDQWLKDAAIARASLIVAKDLSESDMKGEASQYMENADIIIAGLRDEGAPESTVGVLEALSFSFWYLVDGSISKAMKFPKMVDNLYKEHPEDFHVLLLSADRYLHSPGIVGGNIAKGRDMFLEAEKVMDENGAAEWDRFTVYSGIAYGYDRTKKHEQAVPYAELAASIYTADATVSEILEK